MVANSPGFFPKAAVTASRVAYYPFSIPQKLNDSATLTGSTLNHMVGGINAAVGSAYAALQPRGPAKWLLPLFDRVNTAVAHSDQIAQRNKDVFWDPMSQGFEGIGRAIAGPGTYWYLRKSGVEQPTADMIKATLKQGLFDYSPPAGGGGGEIAAPSTPMPEASQQAAEGAGDIASTEQAAA